MSYMFQGAKEFNQPLQWNTARLKISEGMFRGATSCNQPLVWNVSSLKNSKEMFSGATAFSRPLVWNVSSLRDARRMFHNARSFSQRLTWYCRRDVRTDNILDGPYGTINLWRPTGLWGPYGPVEWDWVVLESSPLHAVYPEKEE